MPIRKAVYLYLVCAKLEYSAQRYWDSVMCLADLLKRYPGTEVSYPDLHYYKTYWDRAINPVKAIPYLGTLAFFTNWLEVNGLLHEVPQE